MDASKEYLTSMVKRIHHKLAVETIDATGFTTEARYAELAMVAEARKEVTKACGSLAFVSPESRYDLEYSTSNELGELTGVECRFEGTHYWHWTPILSDFGLLGSVLVDHHQPRILEVAAGNGSLLRALERQFWKSRISAVEISAAAVTKIREMGFEAYEGRIQNLNLEADTYNMVFLSYFVDRDLDQRSTFQDCRRITRPNATVVLEGLFPCVLTDSNGVSYGNANVTRGNDALEDIELVNAEFNRLDFRIVRVIVGQRLVYSLDGSEVLPSYTLIFKKN